MVGNSDRRDRGTKFTTFLQSQYQIDSALEKHLRGVVDVVMRR